MIKYIILLILVSCSADVKLVDEQNNYFLTDLEAEVVKYEELPWKVGVRREQEITMGFRLRTDIPRISEDDYIKLQVKHGVDTWIYQFVKRHNGRNTTLGYASIPLKRITRSLDSFTTFVYYSAASVSSSYRRFLCPAWGHNKKINEFYLNYLGKDKPKMFLGQRELIRMKVGDLDDFPLNFDGGDSLIGDYFVRLALWNSKNKRLYTRWFILDGVVTVESEQPSFIKSCVGINEEINPLQKGGVKLEDLQRR